MDKETWNHESILLNSISKLDAVVFALSNETCTLNEFQMYGLELIVSEAVGDLRSIKDAIDNMQLKAP